MSYTPTEEPGARRPARNWTEKARAAGAEYGARDVADGKFNDTPPALLPSAYWPEFKHAYRAVNTHPYND